MSESDDSKKDDKQEGQVSPPPPLPPSGTTAPYNRSDTIPDKDKLDNINWRFRLGVGLAILSILAVALLLGLSLADTPTLAEVTTIPPESAPLAFGILGLHAAIVVAGVLFCYQLLRAGERLLMPFWVLNPGPYLGVKTPPQAAGQNLEDALKTLAGLLKRDEPKDED